MNKLLELKDYMKIMCEGRKQGKYDIFGAKLLMDFCKGKKPKKREINDVIMYIQYSKDMDEFYDVLDDDDDDDDEFIDNEFIVDKLLVSEKRVKRYFEGMENCCDVLDDKFDDGDESIGAELSVSGKKKKGLYYNKEGKFYCLSAEKMKEFESEV